MVNRISLFLLRVIASPFVLALVICIAWFYSFTLAAIGICEVGSNSTPVSTRMAQDLNQFINFWTEVMGLK